MGKCLPTALILCGSLATRLGPLSKTKPKALMLIKGESVIDIIINNLLVSGIKRIVLWAGHLHGQLVDKFKDSKIVQISIENSPFGTGGAIRNAIQHIEGNEFIVLKGDTISQIDYLKVYDQHLKCGLFEQSQEKNVELISRTPLAFGFLSGSFQSNNLQFSPGDHRLKWSKEQLLLWAQAGTFFSEMARKYNMSPTILAIKFCLSFSNVSSVIPGMLNSDEVNENASSSDFQSIEFGFNLNSIFYE
jgi:hypothetical protein